MNNPRSWSEVGKSNVILKSNHAIFFPRPEIQITDFNSNPLVISSQVLFIETIPSPLQSEGKCSGIDEHFAVGVGQKGLYTQSSICHSSFNKSVIEEPRGESQSPHTIYNAENIKDFFSPS